MRKLPFGTYVEITNIAKDFDDEYESLHSMFICEDVTDYWLVRITKDLNKDYEREVGIYLLEREKIDHYNFFINRKQDTVVEEIQMVLEYDAENGYENWDNMELESYEDVIDTLDGGFGIIYEKDILMGKVTE